MIKLESNGETGTTVHASAVVSPKAIIGENVTIGPYCVIADDVEIGDGLMPLSKNGQAWAKSAEFINSPVSEPNRKI